MLLTTAALLLALLGIGIPVAIALGFLAFVLSEMYSTVPLHLALGVVSWGAASNFLLVSVPLFILLGEILLRSGVAEKLYDSISHWIGWLPGGLMHANIAASTAFAASSGSSVATAATIGTVATPLVKRYKYSERLFFGSLAAGGTLGILIPPSINLVIYGWLTETSVLKLYAAGLVPGVLLAALFSVTILIVCTVSREAGGISIQSDWNARLRTLGGILPPMAIFIVVVGSIYAGLATPTESAALGVSAALALAAANGTLSFRMVMAAIDGTMRTTGMIMLIVMAAWFLNFVLAGIGLVGAMTNYVENLGFGPYGLIAFIVAFYVVLGCFMEPLPMMIVTVPVVTPMVVAAGFDPVWFGILIILLCETAMITPPVGINLFVVQGVRRQGNIGQVMIGVIPFIFALVLMIGLIIAFPEVVQWLPDLLTK